MDKEKIIRMMRSQAISDIWKWSETCHLSVFIICALNLMVSVCSLAVTLSTKGLIDGATSHKAAQIMQYSVMLVCSVVAVRVLILLSSIISTRTNAVLLKDMRSMLLHKLLRKRYEDLSGYHSGEMVNRMFSDISVVRNGVLDIVPGIVSMAVSFIGAAAILLAMDWRFVAVLVAGGLLGLFVTAAFRKPIKSRHKAVQESEGKLHSVLQETLENLKLIKASGSEERMERQAERRQQVFLTAQLQKGYFSIGMNQSISLIFQLSWLFCMLWGGIGIYQGSITYGMLAAIIQLVGQIQGPIANAAKVVSQIYGMVSSAERLKEILDLPEEEESPRADGRELYRDLAEIKMSAVNFSYGREDGMVLEDVNCSIRPGDFTAVTGASGNGKSTLFQLLLGIYQPSSGKLEFCFKDSTEPGVLHCTSACRRTRALFAYVPQGNTLFSGTLRENFAMFTDEATDEEIMEAARVACIEGLIEELDDGLDTVIGERGIGLSEGQAQRVAVARAVLSKAPILLLDESTSALDEETEAKLLKNIRSLKDKTCLIVTHRKAALNICDYRIHIENGKLS